MDAIRTENWNRYYIGSGEALDSYCRRIRAELEQLELASRIQWSGRRVWSTHSSPGGCWICDSIGASRGLLRTLEQYGGLLEDKEQRRIEQFNHQEGEETLK